MRKVILFMHVSLDGYICGPGDEGDWVTMREVPGEDMLIFGGTTLAARFAKHNLIDEYRIKLEPVVLGSGKSLYATAYRTELIYNSSIQKYLNQESQYFITRLFKK